jgi:hypothetical protein
VNKYKLNILCKDFTREFRFKFPMLSNDLQELESLLYEILREFDTSLYYILDITKDKMVICSNEEKDLKKGEFIF